MFSTMMTVPLATFPTPMASPPMDITVRSTLNRARIIRAMRMERGMVRPAMREALRSQRKRTMINMIRIAPSIMDRFTWLMDFAMRMDWS